MTRLVPPAKLKSWALIIRCIHQRGEDQAACLVELAARGLWLSDAQKVQAGLVPPPALPHLLRPKGNGRMLGKPELVKACSQLALDAAPLAYEPATILAHRVAAWEDTGVLGGPEGAAVVKAIGDLRVALGDRMPASARVMYDPEFELEATVEQLVWQAVTF